MRMGDACTALNRAEGGIGWQSQKFQIRCTESSHFETKCVRVFRSAWAPVVEFRSHDFNHGSELPPLAYVTAFVDALHELGYTVIWCTAEGKGSKVLRVPYRKANVRGCGLVQFALHSGTSKTTIQPRLGPNYGAKWKSIADE